MKELRKQRNLDDLIDKEVHSANALKPNSKPLKSPLKDADVNLNQAQVHNVIEELYGEKQDPLPRPGTGKIGTVTRPQTDKKASGKK